MEDDICMVNLVDKGLDLNLLTKEEIWAHALAQIRNLKEHVSQLKEIVAAKDTVIGNLNDSIDQLYEVQSQQETLIESQNDLLGYFLDAGDDSATDVEVEDTVIQDTEAEACEYAEVDTVEYGAKVSGVDYVDLFDSSLEPPSSVGDIPF